MSDVKLLARWDGWCDPCATERPLLLTARGEFGPRAWLGGVGMEDRTLVLTCAVCGEWQLCPWDEEFPPEPVAYVEEVTEPVQTRIVRLDAVIPEIADTELLRAHARAEQVAAAALFPAQAAGAVHLTTAATPAPKRKTTPIQHIVLQTASGPARAAAVPSLTAPRAAGRREHDEAFHLLAEGLDLVSTAGR